MRFPPQSSSFTNSVMKIEQPDKSNAQNFTDQTNSPIVQMDNPNPFSIPMKESNSPAPVAFFPGDFNHQQQPSSSSTSGATSTDTPIQQGHVCQVCNKGFSEVSLDFASIPSYLARKTLLAIFEFIFTPFFSVRN